MADHIGGASGALVTGVILIPVLGVTRTLLLLALVLAVNAVGVIPVGRQKAGQTPDRFARLKKRYAAAAIAVGLAAAAAGTVWITHTSQNGDTFTQAGTSLPANNRPGLLADEKTHPIQELAADMTEENRETVVETAETPDDKEISYGQVLHRENVEGYLIITDQLVQGITGHHGPIEMAVLVNTKGVIQAVKVIQSNETESYFEQVREWLPNLTGKNIFQDSPFADVDAVTGATDSSRAVLQTLRAAGRKFASLVLEETQTPKDKQQEGVQRLLPESEQGTSRKIDGRPRNVNMKRLRRLIEQGKLSSQEAEWYQKMPEEDEK